MGTNIEQPRCGSCLWYEAGAGNSAHGLCMHAPPMIQVILPPPNAVTGKPQPPMVQGLRPPTAQNDRCHHHTHHHTLAQADDRRVAGVMKF
jgi:hypothetical protein